MSPPAKRQPLSADRPVADPSGDRLGHARFAARMANCIRELAPAQGLAVGLHGAPGSGRSSALNMVCHELRSGGLETVALNPWELGAQLDAALADACERADGGRLVVAMDDIDRLDPAERAALARIVQRAKARPDTVLVMVFDRARTLPVDLGRLIQAPFDLPLPDGDSLTQLLLEALQQVLAESPSIDVVSEAHWEQVFDPGVRSLVATPRDVALLENALRTTYPPVCQEVNAADFIAIQAIRIFLPGLHDTIRRNPDRFAGRVRTVAVAGGAKEDRSFHDTWSEALPGHVDGDAVRTLVLRLFPTVPEFPGTVTQRDASGAGLRRMLRVGSREILPVYFQLAVPERAVSHVELSAMLAALGDPEMLAGGLLTAAGQRDPGGASHARTLLSRLSEEVAAVDPQRAGSAVGALLSAGDEIARQDAATGELVARVIAGLLRRLDEPARHALLSTQSATAAALATLVLLTGELGREHGRHGAAAVQARMLTEPHLDDLELRVVERLRAAAASGRLTGLPQLDEVLAVWLVWDRSECTRWVSQTIRDPAGLGALLTAHVVTGLRGPAVDLARFGALVNPGLAEPFVRRLAGGADAPAAAGLFLLALEPEDDAIAV